MCHEAQRAKELLVHYMRLIAKKSGVGWDSDNEYEVAEIVDALIEAAASEGAKRALRAVASSAQE